MSNSILESIYASIIQNKDYKSKTTSRKTTERKTTVRKTTVRKTRKPLKSFKQIMEQDEDKAYKIMKKILRI
jgi:hypothetical protein